MVAFNAIEELYAEPVELIGADQLMDLRAGGSEVSAEELWGERPHRQMGCLDVGPGDLPSFGERAAEWS